VSTGLPDSPSHGHRSRGLLCPLSPEERLRELSLPQSRMNRTRREVVGLAYTVTMPGRAPYGW